MDFNKLRSMVQSEKAKTSAIYNHAILKILNGTPELVVIEQLVDAHDALLKRFNDYTLRDTRPIEINGVIYEMKEKDRFEVQLAPRCIMVEVASNKRCADEGTHLLSDGVSYVCDNHFKMLYGEIEVSND